MNPGVFVMGGGGAGGGGKAGADGAQGDGQGGNGGNGGNGAGNDGRSACGSGLGNQGGCPNHHGSRTSPGVSRGDPVDVATGHVITEPVTDARLAGPLPFALVRQYRSAFRDHDVGLGWGWSHSFAWRIRERRRTVVVSTAAATQVTFERPVEGKGVIGSAGWVLAHTASAWVLDTNDGLIREFIATDTAGVFRLVSIRDRHGNTLRLTYDAAGRLSEMTDAVGRRIRLNIDASGRIRGVLVKNAASQGRWITLATYLYDERGDLTVVADAEGCQTRYTYDEHRLVSTAHPNGVTFYYVYDAQGRCVETWGRLPEGDEGYLAPGIPGTLADGTTAARGIHHCQFTYGPDGYVEIVDSVKLQRAFVDPNGRLEKIVDGPAVYSRTYDDIGMLTSFTDPNGATWRFQRDGRGNELAVTDPLGATTLIERDPSGDIRRITGPVGEITAVTPRPDGLSWTDPVGATFDVRLDARGLVTETTAPNGATMRFVHDELGNLVRRTDPLGATWTMEYDYLGRCVAATSPTGAPFRYDVDLRGRCLAIRRTVGYHRFDYDAMGALVAVTDEAGRTTRFVRRGLGKLCGVIYPDGSAISLRYDREGRLVHVENELGEVHRFALNSQGLVTSETFFDGRVVSYGHDLCGRLTTMKDASGDLTEFVYDAAGHLVARQYADGAADRFEYDLSGRLIGCDSAGARVDLERNAVGWVTKERVQSGDFTSEVITAYDTMGNAVVQRSSLGHEARFLRNLRGWAERVHLDGAAVAFAYDVVGRPVRCVLPAGGVVETGYDANDRMTWRAVQRPTSVPIVGPGEPDWVGPKRPGVVLSQQYQYAPAGELVSWMDSLRGETQVEYDTRGQMVACIPDRGRRALFGYDAAGNVFEGGERAACRYGPGNRLLQKGDTIYAYDGCGRLAERRTRSEQGDRFTRLTWTTGGQLSAIDMDDGTRVDFAYDAFSRRTRKVVTRAGDGGRAERTTHRYVWAGGTLLHSLIERDGRVLERRTHAFDELRGAPWAQKIEQAHDDVMVGEGWQFVLTDDVGTPERILAGDGSVAREVPQSPWGAASNATSFGFPGQVHDPETGLTYNRHRYYDPAVGRYISPDPLGIYPDLNTYRYAGNDPFNGSDPEGLSGSRMTSNVAGFGGGPIRTQSGQAPRREDPAINEAVNNAVAGRSDLAANRGCAEVNALHEMAQRIRDQARERREGELSNEDVRTRLREAFRNGATITTTDENGNLVNPCPRCAQIFRELGLHPQNINLPGESPTRGGVVGPPNPHPRRGDLAPPFPGGWDGAHVHVKGGPSRRGANTNRSNTPPFRGT
ncbi:RHS repeat-associated core domain-containing protein [Sorangium sp. So ce321]|uniref:RHS repeat-associated core domain-containing protein n=1 Tax=Sorangium sp. So ce321 TaxID=3133300 RepID=UPI003F600F2A